MVTSRTIGRAGCSAAIRGFDKSAPSPGERVPEGRLRGDSSAGATKDEISTGDNKLVASLSLSHRDPGSPSMSDRNVLELGCSKAYDRADKRMCGLNFPGARGVRADLAAIGGPGECLLG